MPWKHDTAFYGRRSNYECRSPPPSVHRIPGHPPVVTFSDPRVPTWPRHNSIASDEKDKKTRAAPLVSARTDRNDSSPRSPSQAYSIIVFKRLQRRHRVGLGLSNVERGAQEQ